MNFVHNSGSLGVLYCTAICCLLVTSLLTSTAHAQFFTKTSKSVPRMGRRSEPTKYTAQPEGYMGLGSSSGSALNEALRLVRLYDTDGDGSLSVEELLPLVAMADSPDLLRRVHELLDASNSASGRGGDTEWAKRR